MGEQRAGSAASSASTQSATWRAERQRAAVGERGERGQLALAGRRVQAGRDPGLGHQLVAGRERVGVLLRGGRRDLRAHEADRVVEQDPGRLAPLPAPDLAARRVGCGGVDARDLERPRVGERDVAVERVDDDRPLRRQLVQVPLGRQPVHRRRVPELDLHPAVGLAIGRLLQQSRDPVLELLQVEDRVVQARLGEQRPAVEGVAVAVVDARHHRGAAGVDRLGRRAGERADLVVRADRDQLPAGHGDGGRPPDRGVHCEHPAADDHRLGGLGAPPGERPPGRAPRPPRR